MYSAVYQKHLNKTGKLHRDRLEEEAAVGAEVGAPAPDTGTPRLPGDLAGHLVYSLPLPRLQTAPLDAIGQNKAFPGSVENRMGASEEEGGSREVEVRSKSREGCRSREGSRSRDGKTEGLLNTKAYLDRRLLHLGPREKVL